MVKANCSSDILPLLTSPFGNTRCLAITAKALAFICFQSPTTNIQNGRFFSHVVACLVQVCVLLKRETARQNKIYNYSPHIPSLLPGTGAVKLTCHNTNRILLHLKHVIHQNEFLLSPYRVVYVWVPSSFQVWLVVMMVVRMPPRKKSWRGQYFTEPLCGGNLDGKFLLSSLRSLEG